MKLSTATVLVIHFQILFSCVCLLPLAPDLQLCRVSQYGALVSIILVFILYLQLILSFVLVPPETRRSIHCFFKEILLLVCIQCFVFSQLSYHTRNFISPDLSELSSMLGQCLIGTGCIHQLNRLKLFFHTFIWKCFIIFRQNFN